MARKRQWLLLGLLGTAVGVVVKLVRGRRSEDLELGRWEEPPPPPPGPGAAS